MPPTAADKQLEAITTAAPATPRDAAAAVLNQYVVHLVGPDDASDSDALVTTHVLLNLLPRVFRRVHYDGTPAALNFPESHKARIILGRPQAAPSLRISTRARVDPSEVGPTLYVGSRGWVAYLSTDAPPTDARLSRNGITATYAAALGVSDAFNRAFQAHLERAVPVRGTYLYDIARLTTARSPRYDPDVSSLHIEDALLVGAGAVGQAFLAALSALPRVTGDLRIVEHDVSDEGNEQRCLFAFPETRQNPKALVVQQSLQQRQPYLRVDIPIAGLNVMVDYGAYRLTTRGRRPEKIVITALDQEQARRDVQSGLHQTILNGWTETNSNQLAYGIGRHEIGKNGCLICFHMPLKHPPSEAEFAANRTGFPLDEADRRLRDASILTTLEEVQAVARRLRIDAGLLAPAVGKPFVELIHGTCGVATMDVQGEPVVASVTHVPTLVGSLLAAQYVLLVKGEDGLEHLAIFDGLRLPTDFQVDRREPKLDCYCRNEIVQRVYKREWSFPDQDALVDRSHDAIAQR